MELGSGISNKLTRQDAFGSWQCRMCQMPHPGDIQDLTERREIGPYQPQVILGYLIWPTIIETETAVHFP